MSSLNTIARFAGLLYLIIAILGPVGMLYLPSQLVVSGDAAASRTFDLGAFLLADGMFFILDGKSGMLRLVDANTKEYKELASAQVLHGEDVWGPMALSDGKLIIRDMSEMVCLQVGSGASGKKK